MKTATTIEAQEERKKAENSTHSVAQNSKPVSERERARRNASTERLRPFQFQPGISGNPGGRPTHDVASEIAQALFTNNPDVILRSVFAGVEER